MEIAGTLTQFVLGIMFEFLIGHQPFHFMRHRLDVICGELVRVSITMTIVDEGLTTNSLASWIGIPLPHI